MIDVVTAALAAMLLSVAYRFVRSHQALSIYDYCHSWEHYYCSLSHPKMLVDSPSCLSFDSADTEEPSMLVSSSVTRGPCPL